MIEFEWWIWIIIGIATGIYIENLRRRGRHAIPWEVRHWFSEHWPAIIVYTPIAVGLGAVISVFTFAFLGLDFYANVGFIVLLCDSPILVYYMWISRSKNPKNTVEKEAERSRKNEE